MSYGLLANPPVTLLPVFSESSFDYSTSSTSTIDTVLLQSQTDAVYTDASAQSIVLTNIGIINTISASGSGTIGTNSTYNSSFVLASGSYYAISFVFNFNQTGNTYKLNAVTLQDNFGNIYDAGAQGTTGASVKSCSILSNKLYVGDGSQFSLTIYSQATNVNSYSYNIQTNILKIK